MDEPAKRERPRITRMDARKKEEKGSLVNSAASVREGGIAGKRTDVTDGSGGLCVRLVSEIPETETDPEILAAQKLDHCLKFVSLFAGHSDLSILELALNFGV